MLNNKIENKDVIIIGGGVIGAAIAYQLARYKLDILLLEKNAYFADETSRGNSGVIHGGFDAESHKIEAHLNVEGNSLWRNKIFKDLIFPRKQIDSLVIAFNDKEMEQVQLLYDRGITNKVPKEYLKIISKEELLLREPNLNKDAVGALLCTSSWAIDPVKATLAFLGAAENNNVKLKRTSEVTNIEVINDGFIVEINNKIKVKTKNIINAAGHYSDEVAKLCNYNDFKLTTRRGEYRILAKTEANIVNSICFMVPTIHGKGVIVSPMLDGRVLVGPTARENVLKENTRLITIDDYKRIGQIGRVIIPSIKMNKTEMVLSGSRPIDVETNDFIIRYSKDNKHFINVAGMQSPGLSSAPAIALMVEKLLKDNNIKLEFKKSFNPKFKVMW